MMKSNDEEAPDAPSGSDTDDGDTPRREVDPASIPDELVTQMLADARFRTTLDELQQSQGLPRLAELSPENQRAAARVVIALMIERTPLPPDAPSDASASPTAAPTTRTPPPAPAPPRSGNAISRLFGRFLRRDG